MPTSLSWFVAFRLGIAIYLGDRKKTMGSGDAQIRKSFAHFTCPDEVVARLDDLATPLRPGADDATAWTAAEDMAEREQSLLGAVWTADRQL